MVIITVLFLALLFLAGFFNLFFHFPSKKFFAWLQQYFAPKQSSSSSSSSAISSSQASLHKERNGHNKTEFKKVFATFDKNGDGFITKQELKESLKNIRILVTEKEVEEMVLKVDANGDGLIEFDEFCVLCEAMVGQEGTSELGDGSEGIGKEGVEEDLKEAFGVFDKDKDGLISVEELGLVLCSLGLKEGKKVEDCKEMIRKVDMDGDGMVNYDEFKMMMKGGGKLLLAS
jgi:Ca2+-binding EF-hand superfamily protein